MFFLRQLTVASSWWIKKTLIISRWTVRMWKKKWKFKHWGSFCNVVLKKNLNVKWSRYRPGVAQRVGRGIALLFRDRGTRRGWVVSSTPRPHFTPGKDPVPMLQKAGWAPGPVWTGSEILVPTGIRSQTLQPVDSRYTDWATQPTVMSY